MKKLKTTYKQLDLSQYEVDEKFEAYCLENYDFNENLDFDNKTGVYLFTKRDMYSTYSPIYRREVYLHTPLYCGKTKDFNNRFNKHFKAEDLKEAYCDYISVYFCDTQDASTDLEEKILSQIKFPFNTDNNNNPKYKEGVMFTEV